MSYLRDLTLLFVEDDPDTRHQMKLLLEGSCRELYLAASGEEGLEHYRAHRPDIILSDINLPNLDGLEMVRRIREDNPDQVILLISAVDDRRILIEAIDISVDGFISKPVLDLEQLLGKLEKAAALHKRRQRAKDSVDGGQGFKTLYYQAYHDALTGIPNRHFFREQLQALLQETEVTLFFIDLDNLKTINDRFGHAAGDEVLKAVANRLETLLPEEGIVARIGGDEFVIVLKGQRDLRDRIRFAEEILERATRPLHRSDGTELELGCSIGVCSSDGSERDPDQLIHYADMAMYRAKREGKGRYRLFSPDEGEPTQKPS